MHIKKVYKNEASANYRFYIDRSYSQEKPLKGQIEAKNDVDALRKVMKRLWGDSFNPLYIEPDAAELIRLKKEEGADFDSDEVSTLKEFLEWFAPNNGDGDDFLEFIERPDGTYLFDAFGD